MTLLQHMRSIGHVALEGSEGTAPLPVGGKSSHAAGALAVRDDAMSSSLVPLQNVDDSLVDELETLVCPTPRMGLYNVTVSQHAALPWLPQTSPAPFNPVS